MGFLVGCAMMDSIGSGVQHKMPTFRHSENNIQINFIIDVLHISSENIDFFGVMYRYDNGLVMSV